MLWSAKYPKEIALPSSWRQLNNGEQYCNLLTQYFSAWFPKILGYHFLKLGGLSAEIAYDLFLPHQIILSPEITDTLNKLSKQQNTSFIQAKLTELPFLESSIDACLLTNILNFSQDPHQILREVNRILIDDGYLFLSLFNPISPLLFKRYFHKKPHDRLLFRHYLLWRIIDWLELLNFEILECKPLLQSQKTSCFSHLVTIVARKQTYPLTLNPQKICFHKQPLFEPANAFRESILGK
ncbi:methyltransferase domain-containing protein [Pasteurella canis]|uniref:class I SAM-dependent methyltransferase n=1 Tax=Pasteurella canis TaxID=753 RepID=UPI001CC3BFCB|nr:class I SAM-dependent methyltransferase [Pasteurella canis]UAY78489.1 methyltransferase domain-containing protein [Pasteurella canis]